MANSAGSGPYMLANYAPDDELRLTANPEYTRSPVAIKEAVIKHTQDAVTQAQQLESGSVDIAMQIDPDTAKTITSDDVVVTTIPSYNFLYMALSQGAKEADRKSTRLNSSH